MDLDPAAISILLALGFVAGTAGGLIGLGGSIVVIPALVLLLDTNQHLAQAASMILNVVIAIPAAIRHHRNHATPWNVVLRMVPLGVIGIIIGVEVSNQLNANVLRTIFGIFLLYVIVMKILRLYRDRRRGELPHRTSWTRVGTVGLFTGWISGVLGIGGGPIIVPLLQRTCRLPLRNAIAVSSTAMCVTSLFGAYRKNAGLADLTDTAGNSLGLTATASMEIAVWIAPTAMIGSMIGAHLTHKLPIFWVRIAFIGVAGAAAVSMIVK